MRSITSQLPAAIRRMEEQLAELEAWLPQLETFAAGLEFDWKNLTEKAVTLVRDWGGGLVSSGGVLMAGVVSGVSTFVIGLIFSFYILLQKERLARQGRQVLYALLPEAWADKTLEVLRLSGRTFSSFLSGQCVEAVILGALFVAAGGGSHRPNGPDSRGGGLHRLRGGGIAHRRNEPLAGGGLCGPLPGDSAD